MRNKKRDNTIHTKPEYADSADAYDVQMFTLNPRMDRFGRDILPDETRANPEARRIDKVYVRRVVDGVFLRYYERPGIDHPYAVTLITAGESAYQAKWAGKCEQMVAEFTQAKRPLIRFFSPLDK